MEKKLEKWRRQAEEIDKGLLVGRDCHLNKIHGVRGG